MKSGSHTVESKLKMNLQYFAEELDEDISEAFKAFGVEIEDEPEVEHEELEQDESSEDVEETEEEQGEPPAKEVKTITVKFDKEDREVEITDDNLAEYVQKALALDRERERKKEYEKALDRAAKLAGYKDHAEFVSNLDKIEQEQIQKQQTELDQLQDRLLAELEENGVDRELAKQYLENNPLVQQAKQAIEDRERILESQKESEKQQAFMEGWNELFRKYPELVKDAGEDMPPWYTPEMAKRVEAGYSIVDAYELAHRDTIFKKLQKQAEQAAIKKQMLSKRSKIAGDGVPENEPEVPRELSTAFSMFGLSPKLAKKYAKK